jgi:malonyl-CoA O-methyltransferase
MRELSGRLDRAAVRRAFDRASAGYDDSAVLQARVRTELIDRVAQMKLDPRVVLDLGAGTGHGSAALRRLYRRAVVIALDIAPAMLHEARRRSRPLRRFERVCADAFALPIADGRVDLVFSSLLLQWCDDLDAVLVEIRRVLRPGGFVSLSTLGPDTLRELRAAWGAADSATHVNVFLDMHDIGDALGRAGFSEPVLDVDRIILTYADVLALVRDLKRVGAHNVVSTRHKGLTGRTKWRTMAAAYEPFRRDGRLPASYEVVYCAGWAGEPRPARASAQAEVRIPAGTIRRRTRDRDD